MAKICVHKGCGKQFESPDESPCVYHPGPPIFHDAMKGWSCCKKRVISFDDFLAIPGCTTGIHSDVENSVSNVQTENNTKLTPTSIDENGVEQYGNPVADTSANATTTVQKSMAITPSKKTKNEISVKPDISTLDDPDDVDIPVGAKCKRNGCDILYDGSNRGDCKFHPGSAVFHDASKGWSCCKRRVLEFDEFLKIEGCKTGKHLFVGIEQPKTKEEDVECRTDFYQTPNKVIVSVFAKQCDKEKSIVEFSEDTLYLDLFHLGNKRFRTSIQLYGPIKPNESTFKVMGTKVEITLSKANGLSWAGLRAGETGAGMIRFGVSGRTGTIGGKDIIYRNQS
ncbi:HSP20-like chaperone [Dipodascopsis uninucleata]